MDFLTSSRCGSATIEEYDGNRADDKQSQQTSDEPDGSGCLPCRCKSGLRLLERRCKLRARCEARAPRSFLFFSFAPRRFFNFKTHCFFSFKTCCFFSFMMSSNILFGFSPPLGFGSLPFLVIFLTQACGLNLSSRCLRRTRFFRNARFFNNACFFCCTR